MLHLSTRAHIALGTQHPSPGPALDRTRPVAVAMGQLHADAITAIPGLQQALARQREGSIEEVRESTQRELHAEAKRHKAREDGAGTRNPAPPLVTKGATSTCPKPETGRWIAPKKNSATVSPC